MANEIISYIEMCQREKSSLQRGMNYRLGGRYSIILMSVRINAPYQDRVEDDGKMIIYEGHDVSRGQGYSNPKHVDQPECSKSGSLTENGKFHKAAQDYKNGLREPEEVRVYEKIKPGIWSYNGVFHLVDSWQESDGLRKVFKYKLVVTNEDISLSSSYDNLSEPSRVIPSSVKLEVWKRDEGKCVICRSSDELHFDHIIPFSKGGTSLKAENIQLLCARHNLEKRDNII